MAKQKKGRKITDTDRAFYKLGSQDGEGKLKRTIEVLKTTNGYLWDELTRLDKEAPRVGVLLSFETMHQIIKNANKGTKNTLLAHKLKKMTGRARRKYNLLTVEEIIP